MGHLVFVDHLLLLHLFHRDYLTGVLDAADSDLAKGASADN